MQAGELGDYVLLRHAFDEACKDGLSVYDIENVLICGTINQSRNKTDRYRLYYRGLQVVAELVRNEVVIVTVMRSRRG